jgi:antitoxin component HigA of HigAB toxin-antitoxin module
MIADPKPGSKEDEELELLAFLIADYESRTVKIPAVTPAEAICFRMEQSGLTQQDLVPFIGSKGRVSEVLSGKRELTLAMVRKLHEGLGIPLKSLIGEASTELPPRIDPGCYPVKEMFIRGGSPPRSAPIGPRSKRRRRKCFRTSFAGGRTIPWGPSIGKPPPRNRKWTPQRFTHGVVGFWIGLRL